MASRHKVVIYQLLPRLFGNTNTTRKENGSLEENGCGKLNDINMTVLKRIRSLGVSHVWYTGVLRHATTTDYTAYGIPSQHAEIVKGRAGSPYAITDYYDIDPDLATVVPERINEWEALISRTHKAGMKVVMDFVPNHVAREYHSVAKPSGVVDLGAHDNNQQAFSPSNNFYYCTNIGFAPSFDRGNYVEFPAKATGNDVFSPHPTRNDWYETVKLNYGVDYMASYGHQNHFSPVPDTWLKMTDILLYWASKGVDAFRCDMAEMVPTAFWSYATAKLNRLYPDVILIGEVYNPWRYQDYVDAGFTYLYDKVGMYDCLRDVVCGKKPASEITNQWQHTAQIRQHMLYFLENHDEQRIGSDYFAADPLKAIPALVVSTLLSQNPFLLYAGQEFGERGMDAEGFSGCDGRTTIFDYWCVDSLRRGYYSRRKLTERETETEAIYKKVLSIATQEKAVTQGKDFDLMYENPHLSGKQFAFLRKADDDILLVVANFSENRVDLPVKIPAHAFDYLSINEGMYDAVDLLSGQSTRIFMTPDGKINVTISPHFARIYKIGGLE